MFARVQDDGYRTNHVDTVVVGAGTAGAIVAARLAQQGERVTLLEAGGPYRRTLDVPLLGLRTWLRHPERYCWNHQTTPQAALAGRRVWFPTGRLVGGSASINAMIYTRGHPASYDRWGVPGWTYTDLLPYHKRAENFEGGASAIHGEGGPLSVSRGRYRSAMLEAFLRASAEAGIARTDDLNETSAAGAGYYDVVQESGLRGTPGKSYIALARRQRGFVLRTNTRATGLVIHQGRVHGVQVDGATSGTIAAARVVLCLGVVRTPQLLLRAGIGPARELERLGIRVVADRAAVGVGLQDQVRLPVAFRHSAVAPARPDRLLVAAAQYAWSRRGLFASNVCDAAAIAALGSDIPNVRVAFRWRVFPESGLPLVDFEVGLLQPESRGSIRLRSAEADDAPEIDPAYLTSTSDRALLHEGVALARRIAQAPALQEMGIGAEFAPGTASADSHIEAHAASAFHPVGTCRFGVDDAAVVDPQLRVREIDGLYVADASLIPSCVSANAQASVVAIAEKAADVLRQ